MGYAYMNQSCPCPSQPPQPFVTQPSMAQPAARQTSAAQSSVPGPQTSVPANGYSFNCPNTAPGGIEQYPVGMGYIPWQQWQQTYPLEQGFNRGTIFPDLDLPFMMGRCIR